MAIIKIYAPASGLGLIVEDAQGNKKLLSSGDLSFTTQDGDDALIIRNKEENDTDRYSFGGGDVQDAGGTPYADWTAFNTALGGVLVLGNTSGGGGTSPDYTAILDAIEANTFDTNDAALPALQDSIEDLLKRSGMVSVSQSTSLTLTNPSAYYVLIAVRRKASLPDNLYKLSSVTMKELTSRGGEFKVYKNPAIAFPLGLVWNEVGGDSCLEYALGDASWTIVDQKAEYTTNIQRLESRTDVIGDNRLSFGSGDVYVLACKPTIVPASFRSGLNLNEIV